MATLRGKADVSFSLDGKEWTAMETLNEVMMDKVSLKYAIWHFLHTPWCVFYDRGYKYKFECGFTYYDGYHWYLMFGPFVINCSDTCREDEDCNES